MCFTPWGAHTLLVAEYVGDRVQEVDVMGQAHVRFWFSGEIVGPRGVAASADAIAVSEAKDTNHRISLFRKADSTLLWRVGSKGDADGQLNYPSGLRFARDGARVIVADQVNKRVSLFNVRDGAFVAHVVSALQGIGNAKDVEEVEEGYVVASFGNHKVMKVLRDGLTCLVLCNKGSSAGLVENPASVAVLPGGAMVVREKGNGGRLQIVYP